MSFSITFIYNGLPLASKLITQTQPTATVGRNSTNDVVLNPGVISGAHVKFELINGELFLQDLGSTNGTFVNGQRISAGSLVNVIGKTVSLSGQITLNIRSVETDNPPNSIKSTPTLANLGNQILEQLNHKKSVTLGRASSCDVAIDNNLISRNHAKISLFGDKYYIEDLGSMNGTFLNGVRISGRTAMKLTDTIILGRISITLGGKVVDISKEIAIKTVGLVKQFSNGKIGLQECNIEIPSNSLLAVMGPSGCGKSTLLKALNGESPGTKGAVYIGGQELNQYYDYLKMQIGYVPQDDIVHRELTVDESLWYAGKLRLPNFSEEQLSDKINQVLEELNIKHVRSNLVSAISGGQRKRVSIAVEILTDPLILFLDEPTSPLDPQTIEDFLMILKKLSQKGTTVIMVTHKPEDLAYMDQVIFMAEGGYMCYYGKSNEYLSFFGVDDTVKVYSMLVKEQKDRWVRKFNSKPSNQASDSPSAKIHRRTKVDYLSQYYWLTRRYLNIKMNDKWNSLILLAQAPFIALIACLLFSSVSQALMFIMAIAALWLGANNAAREIVSENSIFKRERMFNQGIFPYVFSKVSVLMMFSVVQSILFVGILWCCYNWIKPWSHSYPLNHPIEACVWMMFVSLVATLMGLLLSATVSTAEKVMSLVPLALIPQIMLAGILTKIKTIWIEFPSYLSISRWATEGFNHIQDSITTAQLNIKNIDSLRPGGPTPIIEEDPDSIRVVSAPEFIQKQFTHPKRFGDITGKWELDILMLGVLAVVFFTIIYWAIKRKDTIKING
ncbi:MAG: FHA domain-containing protein [Bacteroidetes bacterium]|nr:FHA domain-containing protein [Bacteroidota bacterium]